jgi:Fe-S cluster assembly protein SufD
LSQEVVLDQPLFLIHEVTASSVGSAYPQIYVDTARHSQMTLVEEYISSGSEPVMVNTVTEFFLAKSTVPRSYPEAGLPDRRHRVRTP